MKKFRKTICIFLFFCMFYVLVCTFAEWKIEKLIIRNTEKMGFHVLSGEVTVGIFKGIKLKNSYLKNKTLSLSASKVEYSFFGDIQIIDFHIIQKGLKISASQIRLKGEIGRAGPILPDISACNVKARINSNQLKNSGSNRLEELPAWLLRKLELNNCTLIYDNTKIGCNIFLQQEHQNSPIALEIELTTKWGDFSLQSDIEPKNLNANFEIKSILSFQGEIYDIYAKINRKGKAVVAEIVDIRKGETGVIRFSGNYDSKNRTILINFPDQQINSKLFNCLLPDSDYMEGSIWLNNFTLTRRGNSKFFIPSGTLETDNFRYRKNGKSLELTESRLCFGDFSQNTVNMTLEADMATIEEKKIKKLFLPLYCNINNFSVFSDNLSFLIGDVLLKGKASIVLKNYKTNIELECSGKELASELPGMIDYNSILIECNFESGETTSADLKLSAHSNSPLELSCKIQKQEDKYLINDISLEEKNISMLSGKGAFYSSGNISLSLELKKTDLGLFENIFSGKSVFPASLKGNVNFLMTKNKNSYDYNFKSKNLNLDYKELGLTLSEILMSGEFDGKSKAKIDIESCKAGYEGLELNNGQCNVIFNDLGIHIENIAGSFYGGTLEGKLSFVATKQDLFSFNFKGKELSLSEGSNSFFRKKEYPFGFQQGTASFAVAGKVSEENELFASGTAKLFNAPVYPASDYFSTLLVEKSNFDFFIKEDQLNITSDLLLEEGVKLTAEGNIALDKKYNISEANIKLNIEENNAENIRNCFFYFIPEVFQESEISGTFSARGEIKISEKDRSFFLGNLNLNNLSITNPSTFNIKEINGSAPLYIDLDSPRLFSPIAPGWEKSDHEELLHRFRANREVLSSSSHILNIGSISFGAFYASGFEVPLSIKNTNIVSPYFRGNFYGGTVEGLLQLSINPSQTGFYMFSYLNRISVSSLCNSYEGTAGMISGTINGVVAFHNEFAEETSTSRGILNVWALPKGDEKRRISKELIVKLGGEQALMFSRIKQIPYDKGELSCILQDKNLIFNNLELYHNADPLGMILRTDLSFELRLPGNKNKIEVERLLGYLRRTGAL